MLRAINYRKNKGFNMLEMLTALLILSIGLLGVAILQARGQQFNYVAYIRTQSVFLAYDIMDRMRLNQTVAKNGGYEVDCANVSENMKNCNVGTCSPSELATFDTVQWCGLISTTLPEGQATIARSRDVDGDNKNDYIITLQWREERTEDAEFKQQEWVLVL